MAAEPKKRHAKSRTRTRRAAIGLKINQSLVSIDGVLVPHKLVKHYKKTGSLDSKSQVKVVKA